MILRHTDGAATLYAHLSAVNLRNPNPNFRRGAEVKAGEVIALSDNMGHSTAPHLHFEYVPGGPIVRSNYRIDPYPCIGGQTEDRIRPTIDRVDPNPVTGSNSPQRFTIYGRNFHSQATVTLRDLRTGEVFPNRPIEAHSRSDTQLVINPRFTEVAAQWDVQVINPGGLGSNRYEFDVIPPGTQVVKLTAADAAAHHRFGHAVAIDGDIMSVSALHSVGSDGYYEVYTGAVYVFERQGANWVEQAKLTPPPSDDFFPIEGWDAFGSSVAISGGTIIVGAPAFEASDLPYGSNAVYVFEREGSSWVQKGKLEGYHVYPAHARDSVGIYGNTVVIGDTALYDEGYLIRPGYVHVFERVGGTWTRRTSLRPWDSPHDDNDDWDWDEVRVGDTFGHSLAVSGNAIVAASSFRGSGSLPPPGAYVYRKSGEAWMEHVKIEGTGTVNISGNTVVFGKRVFRLEGSNWVQQATLDWQRRAIDGNTIVAGDENSAIHVVRYDGANWVNQGRLTPPGDAAASAFGESAAVSGDTIVVGAPNDSEAGERAGAVYVFRR